MSFPLFVEHIFGKCFVEIFMIIEYLKFNFQVKNIFPKAPSRGFKVKNIEISKCSKVSLVGTLNLCLKMPVTGLLPVFSCSPSNCSVKCHLLPLGLEAFGVQVLQIHSPGFPIYMWSISLSRFLFSSSSCLCSLASAQSLSSSGTTRCGIWHLFEYC